MRALTPSGAWLIALLVAPAAAQTRAPDAAPSYPNKPIRMIVPFTAGSATDFLARVIGPKMLETWGQQVIVDNRPSAGGIVAGEIVAHAVPDGHTLMLNSSAFAGSAALYSKLPFDPIKDFAGVSQIGGTAVMLVAAPSLGVKSLKELIALAKQKPGQLNFGSSGIGSGTHYAGELFMLAAGIKAVHVPYKGTPEVVADTIAGRLHYSIVAMPPSVALVRSGRLLGLAVTTAARQPSVPDVPTMAEAALPGFEYDGWFGVFAPGRTPRAIVNKLSTETARILGLSDVREQILNNGVTPKSSTPEAFDKLVRSEIAMRAKIFKAAGAKVE